MITLGARLILGGVFIWFGVLKVMDPTAFLKVLRQYDMASNALAAVLPWFEIWCGLLVVFGVALRGTALTMLMFLVAFTAAVAARGGEIAGAEGLGLCDVAFDCGCGTGVVNVCRKLAENAGLMLAAVLVVYRATPASTR